MYIYKQTLFLNTHPNTHTLKKSFHERFETLIKIDEAEEVSFCLPHIEMRYFMYVLKKMPIYYMFGKNNKYLI